MINVFKERITQARSEESAFTTAELLGNAALGIAGLVVIWGLISGKGGLAQQIFNWISGQLNL